MTESNTPIPGGLAALFDLSFTKFVTLSVIKIIYILGIVLLGLALLGFIIAGFANGFGSGLVALILAPVVGLLYLLILRVQLELIAVIFRIGDNTAATARALGAAPMIPAEPQGFPVQPITPTNP